MMQRSKPTPKRGALLYCDYQELGEFLWKNGVYLNAFAQFDYDCLFCETARAFAGCEENEEHYH